MLNTSYHEFLPACCDIARKAGEVIQLYAPQNISTEIKADNSPVTQADIAANTLIVQALSTMWPQVPVVAEESPIPSQVGDIFWLVDPLDGTRSFVRGEPEYTVNIALIHDGKPVLGVIYCPADGVLYCGARLHGARRIDHGNEQIISARPKPADGVVVVKSRSHPSKETETFLKRLHITALLPSSSSRKFCLLAEGAADIYPRFGRTMEWDTAAGQAILEAAGGRVLTTDDSPLTYGKAGFENPHFIAYGK